MIILKLLSISMLNITPIPSWGNYYSSNRLQITQHVSMPIDFTTVINNVTYVAYPGTYEFDLIYTLDFYYNDLTNNDYYYFLNSAYIGNSQLFYYDDDTPFANSISLYQEAHPFKLNPTVQRPFSNGVILSSHDLSDLQRLYIHSAGISTDGDIQLYLSIGFDNTNNYDEDYPITTNNYLIQDFAATFDEGPIGYDVNFPDSSAFRYLTISHESYLSIFDNLLHFYDYDVGAYLGYQDGYQDGERDGYNEGYNEGYTDGFDADATALTIFGGIIAVGMIPINFFLSIFNFEILGINFTAFVSSLLSVACVLIVIKHVLAIKDD